MTAKVPAPFLQIHKIEQNNRQFATELQSALGKIEQQAAQIATRDELITELRRQIDELCAKLGVADALVTAPRPRCPSCGTRATMTDDGPMCTNSLCPKTIF